MIVMMVTDMRVKTTIVMVRVKNNSNVVTMLDTCFWQSKIQHRRSLHDRQQR